MSRFVDCGRDQAFLLPPDLREWIPEDDLAHFVIEAVERVDMGAFKVNRRGSGSGAESPPDDAGAADLLLCQRDLFEPSDRARDPSRHRDALRCRQQPSRP